MEKNRQLEAWDSGGTSAPSESSCEFPQVIYEEEKNSTLGLKRIQWLMNRINPYEDLSHSEQWFYFLS